MTTPETDSFISGRVRATRRSGSGWAELHGVGSGRAWVGVLMAGAVGSAGSRVPSPDGTRDAAPTDEHRPRAGEPPAARADTGGCAAAVTAPSHHRRLT